MSVGNQPVALSGNGIGLTVSPLTIGFNNQTVGTSSPAGARGVTLSNPGTTAQAVPALTIGGTTATDFSQTNACGTSLAAGTSCVVSLTFTPTAIGLRTGTLTVGTQIVSMSGTGH